MTKKHFILLAEGIRNLEDNPTKRSIARMIARVAMETNPRFNGALFMEAALKEKA